MNRPKRIQFWGEDENDDSLVVEVIDGKKTATVSKADEFYESDGLWCINHQVIDEQAQCG